MGGGCLRGSPTSTILQKYWAANPILGLLGIGQAAIQAIALAILFQKPSSDWFREMRGSDKLSNGQKLANLS